MGVGAGDSGRQPLLPWMMQGVSCGKDTPTTKVLLAWRVWAGTSLCWALGNRLTTPAQQFQARFASFSLQQGPVAWLSAPQRVAGRQCRASNCMGHVGTGRSRGHCTGGYPL